MNIQLLLVCLCLAVAVAFMIKKVIVTLRRKGPPSCGGCPNERSCARRPGASQPPCSLEELRPK